MRRLLTIFCIKAVFFVALAAWLGGASAGAQSSAKPYSSAQLNYLFSGTKITGRGGTCLTSSSMGRDDEFDVHMGRDDEFDVQTPSFTIDFSPKGIGELDVTQSPIGFITLGVNPVDLGLGQQDGHTQDFKAAFIVVSCEDMSTEGVGKWWINPLKNRPQLDAALGPTLFS